MPETSTEAFVIDKLKRRARCRIHTSHPNCWISSSTFYTTQETRSKVVASSPNHGSPAPGSTSSPTSSSTPHQDYGPGKRRFQIVSPPPRATPSLSRFAVLRLSRRQMQREEAGFQRFLISFASRCISQWLMATSISYHSSDSRLSSNLSLLHIWPLRPHAFSISSTRFPFSRTFLCPPAIVPRSLKTATTWTWSSPRALPCLPGPWSFLGRTILYHSCCHYQVASISGN